LKTAKNEFEKNKPLESIFPLLFNKTGNDVFRKGAHTRRGLWKVNPRVSEAARQNFVCVVNAASGFRLLSRPVTLSPLLEVFLAGKGYEMPVLSRFAGKPLPQSSTSSSQGRSLLSIELT
jgi:hypothetical protein